MDRNIYVCDTPLCIVKLGSGSVHIFLDKSVSEYLKEMKRPTCPICGRDLRLIETQLEKH